jgi:HAE1 family hydrophobic/amphiphilic exporter-1
LLFILTLGIVRFVGMEFMPEEDQNQFSINVDLPIGTRFERTGEVCSKIADIMRKEVPELVAYFTRWGAGRSGGAGSSFGREEASYRGSVSARLVSKTKRNASPREIINRIRPLINKIPGVEVRFSVQDPLAGVMFGSGAPLQIDLYGYDLDTAMQYAQTVSRILASIKGVTDVDISRQMEKPEIQVKVDRDKASLVDLNVTNIGKTIETYFSGDTSVKYREAGDEYDIEVRLRKEDRERIEDLRDSTIVTPSGDKIKLSNVTDIKVGLGPTKIERKDKQRIITVSADIQGRDLASVVKDAEQHLQMTTRPAGFSYKFTGAEEERRKSFHLLVMAAVLGMILVYMVMASQFESLRDPFIIFLSIPFGFIGVVWFLVLTRQTLSIVSFIGIIMLIGIVTKNGIVLISYINILRQRGLSIREAVMSGGSNRLRPVLSTTITTILGMIPMALSKGEGSEVWAPMAVAVIGGLSVSTLVTLVLMPTLYSIFEGWKGVKEGSHRL